MNKTLLTLLLLVTAAAQSLVAQTIQTVVIPYGGTSGDARTQNIQVLANEVFELLTWGPAYNGPTGLKVDGVNVAIQYASAATSNAPTVLSPTFALAGPRTVSLVVGINESLVCTYKKTTVTTVAVQNVASQAVVIPENSGTNVDIILESSTDLVTWTAALPGSYSPATSKRFFRVRAVAN